MLAIIDPTQAPYNCRFDFTGSDALAADDGPGLQAALYDASLTTPPGIDLGGACGGLVLMPKGAAKIGQKLVVPQGVRLAGPSMYASVLKMADDFDHSSHFIDIGDATTGIAAMGCGLSDMILYSRNTDADYNRAMIYTNNAQDVEAIAQRMRIYSGNRVGIWGEIGWGGASVIRFADLSINNNGGHGGQNMNPVMIINYGNSTISLDRLNINGPSDGSGGADHVGIWCANGNVKLRGSHFESIRVGTMIAMQSSSSQFSADHVTGGLYVDSTFKLMSPSPAGRTKLSQITRNNGTVGAYTMRNMLAGGTSVAGDIVGQQVF